MGASRFSVEIFLSRSAEKLHRRTLLCCVSENFWYRKSLWIRGGGGEYQDFLPKIFCLTVPKNFIGEPSVLCFRKFLVPKKFMDKRGGVSRFSVENFLSHSPEKVRR